MVLCASDSGKGDVGAPLPLQIFHAFPLNSGCQQIRSQMNLHEARDILYSDCKLKLLCILSGTPHFLVKNNTQFMWQVLWLSPSERTRPMLKPLNESFETSVFITSYKSKDEIKNSISKKFLSSCFTF